MTSDQLLAVCEHVWAWLQPVTNNDGAHYCCQVAHQLRDLGWAPQAGLVSKAPGQVHGVGQDGQLYAVDAIWVELPARSADIITAAGSPEQRPGVIWYAPEQLPPVSSYRPPYGTRTVPLYGQPAPPPDPEPEPPPPDPEPEPEVPWALLLAELAAIRDEVARLHARLDRRWPQEVTLSLPSYLGGQRTGRGWVTPAP